MRIVRKQYTIRQIAEGYKNNEEEGVIAFGGLLNVRPPYQREFVYKDKQRDAVIETIRKGFPLNVMYWSKNDDGTFEVLDGQQRTISFCEFVAGAIPFSYEKDGKRIGYLSMTDNERDEILDYTLDIFVCEGSDKERLDWFRTINIAGEKLTEQELLNANYTGTWLASAKRRFSKTGCVAFRLGDKYLNGTPIRQDYLATTLDWISNGKVEDYMAKHQHDENSDELWNYYQSVIEWVKATFTAYRKEMKGIAWGELYNKYKDADLNAEEIESEVARLMADEDVTNKKGIYEYVLDKEEKHLSIRTFSDRDKRTMYEKQGGIDPVDGQHYELAEMQAHHIVRWGEGGKTILENCLMVSNKNHELIERVKTPSEWMEWKRNNL